MYDGNSIEEFREILPKLTRGELTVLYELIATELATRKMLREKIDDEVEYNDV
ncbi:MAG: hypothetical protein QXI16_00140 [Sulfolobaceae archaeon]